MLQQIERVLVETTPGAEPVRHGFDWLVHRAHEVFGNVSLEGKTLLEIGSGTGLFCFYAVSQGAQAAVGLEPETAGSTSGMLKQFEAFRDATGAANVETLPTDFQSYDAAGLTFDIVLSYNSVNHLNEEACTRLRNDEEARTAYNRLFRKVRCLLRDRGVFIVWDVARTNGWNVLGLRNPFEPTIDWKLHQDPDLWTGLLRDAGFPSCSVTWPTYYPLRRLGPLLNNRLCSYLTSSRFRIAAR